jgi:predicted site-specific integrase-resolvase
METPKGTLGIREAAEQFRVPYRTMCRWAATGKVASVTVAGRRYINVVSLANWLAPVEVAHG